MQDVKTNFMCTGSGERVEDEWTTDKGDIYER
jgi:hypothetical protein